MTGLIVHPKVAGEVADAARWYREIDPELALRFLDEIYKAIQKAREMPLLFRIIENPYRRVLCETFPYRIVFEVIEEMRAVHIVSVIHQLRQPDRWEEGLE
ncbi:MAG: type II toxin-antitoxin system RelE/ParE family toxin [Luteolibacter sp.]|uniref:type II toxin-antitoxin system RelE/ParE family toxin n=1 Tax=Luteolibacter sp. TaxID=1962973 RepID=UPI0032635856